MAEGENDVPIKEAVSSSVLCVHGHIRNVRELLDVVIPGHRRASCGVVSESSATRSHKNPTARTRRQQEQRHPFVPVATSPVPEMS